MSRELIIMEKPENLKVGDKVCQVTHRHFSNNEWITMNGNWFLFEDGVTCSQYEFWKWRTDESWNAGYYIFN